MTPRMRFPETPFVFHSALISFRSIGRSCVDSAGTNGKKFFRNWMQNSNGLTGECLHIATTDDALARRITAKKNQFQVNHPKIPEGLSTFRKNNSAKLLISFSFK